MLIFHTWIRKTNSCSIVTAFAPKKTNANKIIKKAAKYAIAEFPPFFYKGGKSATYAVFAPYYFLKISLLFADSDKSK